MDEEIKREKNRARRLRYKLKNPERYKALKKATDARYRENHKEEKRLRDTEYRIRNAEKIKIQKAKYHIENKEVISTKRKMAYLENKEPYLQRSKTYRENNKEKSQNAIKAWCIANPQRVRELGARRENIRRARRRNGKTISYERYNIFIRDKKLCYLCKEMINYSLRHPNPKSFSIDHIIPISKGGDDTPYNVASAHLVCNQSKHAKVLDELPSINHIKIMMMNMKERVAV